MNKIYLIPKSLTLSLLCILVGVDCLYSQSTGWQELKAEGNASERHENAFVRAGDTFILLGGRGLKSVDLYDTQTKEWTQGAQPPFEIHHIQAVEFEGLVYVIGAFTGGWPFETPLPNILIYDPLLDAWAIGPEIPADRRRGAGGTVIYNDKIYVVGGIINGHTSGWVNWLDEFDPATNKWRKLADAPRARDHFHSAVIGDKLYVAGGRRSGFASEGFTQTVKETNIYDFNNQEWIELPSPEGDIPTERAGTGAAEYEGNFVVLGGESGSQEQAHNQVEMLNTASETWSSLMPLERGRHGTQAIYFDNKIFIGAGSGNRGGGPELNSFEFFAPEGNPEIPAKPLTKADIIASTDHIRFSGDQQDNRIQFTIESRDGNQASLISYVQVDNADFDIRMPIQAPFALSPGQKVPVTVVLKENAQNNKEANLLIKAIGNSEPLNVKLSVEN